MNQPTEVVVDPPFVVVQEPAFTARFVLASSEVESVENVDAFVDLPDGSSWSLTIFTIDEIGRLLRTWQESGEHANGSYFWAADQLIVAQPGIAAMVTAIRELVRTNDITRVGARSNNQPHH
ncbi:hypothetical protein [Luedemannella helvata]|uniref:Uncharacterized protein n=1 Tax=Luedemannella helvata TaxID=349315 RepID=A0ABP4X1T9_9ACTN